MDVFITTSTKTTIFTATKLKKTYYIPLLARLSVPHCIIKTWKAQWKLKGSMLFINATLSKNQLYKHQNQINKVPTISKEDDIEFFSDYFCTSFFNVCNLLSCYHNSRTLICRYQEVMLKNNVELFCQLFVNFSITIRTRL